MSNVPLFEPPQFELILGDCLEVMGALPEESVDLIVADPPYNLSNDGFSCSGGRMVSVNKGEWDRSEGVEVDFEFHKLWLASCKRLLKPGGSIWVSGTYHSIYSCGFAMQQLGFHILNDIAWFKPNASPNLSRRFFTASHETLIWARRSQDEKHTFNYAEMREGDFAYDKLKAPGKQMRSVWSIPTTPKREKLFGKHPTQKPERLLDRIIASSSNTGDLVLDPFVGSGTTGVIAARLGRRFIGIDISPEFLEIARKRIENEVSPG